jgi:hypothetical protein
MSKEDFYRKAYDKVFRENSRLKKILNLYNDDKHLEYESDIQSLIEQIPELEEFSHEEIAFLYGTYSDQYFCANWLVVDKHTGSEFKGFLIKNEVLR